MSGASLPKRFIYYQQHGTARAKFVALGLKLLFGHTPKPSEQQLQQFAASFSESDDLAERVVAEVFAQLKSQAHPYLKQVLEQGSHAVGEEFPALKELLLQAETTPEWVDFKRIEQGQRVIHRCGRFAMYALGDLSLLGGYANNDIIKPLTFTGALAGNTTFDRVSETTQFWHDVTTIGNLEKGAKGYCTAIHVRIMHAFVRRRLLKHPDWDQEEWGVPINQGDALATNVAFSMFMLTGCALQGMRFSRADIEAVLHLWRYVAYLMGDKQELLPNTLEEGVDWVYMITQSSRLNPDTECIDLANSYLESYRHTSGSTLRQFAVYWFHRVYANYLIPSDIKKVLKIPKAPVVRWLPLALIPVHLGVSLSSHWLPRVDKLVQRVGRNSQTNIVNKRLQGRKVAFEASRPLQK